MFEREKAKIFDGLRVAEERLEALAREALPTEHRLRAIELANRAQSLKEDAERLFRIIERGDSR